MDYRKILNDRLDMVKSLQDSIQQAGGVFFPWSELKQMTLEEAVERFGQNGIRFTKK